MTETLVRSGADPGARTASPAARLLDLLTGVSEGRTRSFADVAGVYGDVRELLRRVERLGRSGMEVEPSPYLLHLDALREIEEDVCGRG